MAKFKDVLKIVNGKNQKKVENQNGKYPIYGSGGIMGYADEFICDKNTVVIGRKGSINKPIYVEVPFWNVDTAFGLVANKSVLESKYLYYFCENFDFEQLNTTVTIPSLTKANLQNIEMPLPPLEEQQKISAVLDKVSDLIAKRRQQLEKLDLLVKARFTEMFGDMMQNPKEWSCRPLEEMAGIVSGITKGRKTKENDLIEVPYMAVSNVKDGYIDWTTIKTILATRSEIEMYRLMPNDVLMTEGGDPDKLGRGAIIYAPLENCIHQNHIFRVRLNATILLPIYFSEFLKHQRAKQYFLRCAKQTTGIASINMRQLKGLPTLVPPIELQNQFADFVEQVEKTKTSIKESLTKLETLKKALMQEYFG